jgi:hydrogenase/urease accessory protein HupE
VSARLPSLLPLFIAVTVLNWPGPVCSHEVRPALLQIGQRADGHYEVLWKQPVQGEIAVHLVPHISGGLLDSRPDAVAGGPNFRVESWHHIDGGKEGLDGRTLEIQGLNQTITDALISITLANGDSFQQVLNPRNPSLVLHLSQKGLAAGDFLVLGIRHIVTGPDHLLFLLGLLLIVRDRRMLLKTVTAFTLAHSLTLAAATLGAIRLSTPLINALIALSILFIAPEVIRAYRGGTSLTIRYPWIVAFAFGLLHGMGFASGLTSFGLTTSALLTALLLFNIGVEIGQLAFIALVVALRRSFRLLELSWPRPVELLPAYFIGSLGAFWTFEYCAVAFGAS